MILSRRVSLHGVQLDQLNSAIVIRNVTFGSPKENVQAVSRIGGAGQRITTRHIDTLDVAVVYAINLPKTSLQSRRTVYETVCAWALQGGWLTVGHNNGRRMWVEQVTVEDPEDFWDWTKDFTILFRAYSVPFWQDATATSTVKESYNGNAFDITVTGHYRTVLDVEYKNTSGSAMTAFSITAGNSTIALTGLSIANNSKLTITHDETGLLKILNGTTSLMDKRSSGSSDDLYIDPGTRSVTATTASAGDLTVSFYGRYA